MQFVLKITLLFSVISIFQLLQNAACRRQVSLFDGSPSSSSSSSSSSFPLDSNRTAAHLKPPRSPPISGLPAYGASRTTTTTRPPQALEASSARAIQQQAQQTSATSSQRHLSQQSHQRPASSQQTTNTLASVRSKWRQMEQSLGNLMNGAALDLRGTLEELLVQPAQAPPGNPYQQVAAAQPRPVSLQCKQALIELMEALADQELWASQMVDASAGHFSSLPSGLLEGTLTDLGHYDECLAISQPERRAATRAPSTPPSKSVGQYCSLLIKPPLLNRPRLHTVCRRLPSLSPLLTTSGAGSASAANATLKLLAQHSHQFYYAGLRLGICVPSRCSQTDVQQLLSSYLIKFELVGQVKHCQQQPAATGGLQAANGSSVLGSGHLPLVSSISQHFDPLQQCILITFIVLFLLIVVGTLLDDGHKQRARASTEEPRGGQHGARLVTGGSADGHHQAGQATAVSSANRRRWQQYRVCHSNSASCHGSEPNRLLFGSLEQSLDTGHPERTQQRLQLGLQKNPLVSLADQSDTRIIGQTTSAKSFAATVKPTRKQRLAHHKTAESTKKVKESASCKSNNIIELLPIYHQEPPSSKTALKTVKSATSDDNSILRQLLLCFSLKSNLRSIGKLSSAPVPPPPPPPPVIEITNGEDGNRNRCAVHGPETRTQHQQQRQGMSDIKVIHGLRTVSMIWIIFGHTIGLVSPEMMNSLFGLAELSCSSRFLQALLNTTLAVDTFFMISGLVTVISFVRKCKSALALVAPPTLTSTATTRSQDDTLARLAAATAADSTAEVSSVDSSSGSSVITSLSSTTSSNRQCIGLSSKSSSQKNFIVNKALRMDRPQVRFGDLLLPEVLETSTLIKSKTSSTLLPDDFRPIVWLLMRYLRLTPAYAFTIGLSVLMPSLGSGPFWPETVGQLGPACRANWWTNLLYVNNFIETDKLCLIHSWYLSNDFQFFLLALVLFGLFYKSSKLALLALVSVFVASSAATFTITLDNEYPPTIVTTSPAVAERWEFIYSLYYKPWPHLPSYLVGLLVGCMILKLQLARDGGEHESGTPPFTNNQSRLRLSRGARLACWLLFSVIALAVLNSVYPWNMGLQVDPVLAGIHSATFRTLWATCCAWLVFALVGKPRNPLALMLSWHGFQLTSRLTYCAYLVHPLVIFWHFGWLRERIDSSVYGQLHRFMATLMLSYLLAFLVSICVESPSIQVQRLLAKLLLGGDQSEGGNKKTLQKNLKGCGGGGGGNVFATKRDKHDLEHFWRGTAINPHDHGTPTTTNGSAPSSSTFSTYFGSELEGSVEPNQTGQSAGSLDFSFQQPQEFAATSHSNHLMMAAQVCPAVNQQHLRASCELHGCPAQSQSQPTKNNSPLNLGGVDEEFQRKLAQAIGKGFRMRSKIVNGTLKQQQAVRPAHQSRCHGQAKQLPAMTVGDLADLAPIFAGPDKCQSDDQRVQNGRPMLARRSESLSTFMSNKNDSAKHFG